MNAIEDIDQLSTEQIRELAVRLQAEIRVKQVLIDKLTHEMASRLRGSRGGFEANRLQADDRPAIPQPTACRRIPQGTPRLQRFCKCAPAGRRSK